MKTGVPYKLREPSARAAKIEGKAVLTEEFIVRHRQGHTEKAVVMRVVAYYSDTNTTIVRY